MYQSVAVVCCWLLGGGCRVLMFYCRVSLSVVAVVSWLSPVLPIDSRRLLSPTFLLSVPSSAYNQATASHRKNFSKSIVRTATLSEVAESAKKERKFWKIRETNLNLIYNWSFKTRDTA
jgi:hypothetical protein